MADRFQAQVELTTSAGTSQTTMSVRTEVEPYYKDMRAAGCGFALNASLEFMDRNQNKARLAIMRGDAIVDADFCPGTWTEAELLAAVLLRRESWLQLPPVPKSPTLVPDAPFRAEFTFHHLDGSVTHSQTYGMPGDVRPFYQDMLDAGCTLRWTLADELQPNGEVAVVSSNGDKLVTELVYDTYVDLTNGFIHLLRLEPWLR